MGLIACFACGRQRQVKPIRKHVHYFCPNCGARQLDIGLRRSGSDREGIDAEKAKHETFAALKRHAEVRGYKQTWPAKPDWVAVTFKKIFGRWPNGEAVEPSAPAPAGLLRWVRRENRAFRKRKREEELRLAGVGNRFLQRGTDLADPAAVHPLMSDDDWKVKL